eukprot:1289922-Pyramimonas_sp.AAC.1
MQSFSGATARSLDQFHARHFLLLEDDGLDLLAGMWQCCEAIGLLPKQLSWVLRPMLPKPSTGDRLIVLYSGMYRIWQRLRRPMLGALMEEVERGYWGASRGR